MNIARVDISPNDLVTTAIWIRLRGLPGPGLVGHGSRRKLQIRTHNGNLKGGVGGGQPKRPAGFREFTTSISMAGQGASVPEFPPQYHLGAEELTYHMV